MISEKIIDRIRWHAGFNGIESVQSISISDASSGITIDEQSLSESVEDMINVLSELNVEMNSQTPSGQIAGKKDHLPRALAYALAEVVRMVRGDQIEQHNAVRFRLAWRIECAWLAVLSGDIDNVAEHVAVEEAIFFSKT